MNIKITVITLITSSILFTGCMNSNSLSPTADTNSTQEKGLIGGLVDNLLKKVEGRIETKTKITQAKGEQEQALLVYKQEREENRILDKIFGRDTRGEK